MNTPNRLQIRILLLSQFLVIACLDMADPYWPLIVQHIGTSNLHSATLWTTLIYMAPFLMTIFTAPLWGYIGKKYGYKKMLIRASVVLALTQLLLFVSHSLSAILVLRLIQGAFAGFTASAQAWLICSTHENEHGYFIGKVQAFMAIGTIFGPVLGGVIAHYYSYSSIFLISGIICVGIVLLLTFYITETNKMPLLKLKEIKLAQLKKIPKSCLFWLSFIFLSQVLRWMSVSFFALFVVRHIGGNNITIGVLYGVIAIMIYVSAPWWGRLAYRLTDNLTLLKLSILACLAMASLAQVVYAQSNTLTMALLASGLWGLCLGATDSMPFSLLIHHTSADNKGVMVGFGSSASKMGNLVGIGIGGYIYAISSLSIAFDSIAIGYFVLFIVALLALKTPSNTVNKT